MLFVEHYGDLMYLIHSSVSATTVGFYEKKQLADTRTFIDPLWNEICMFIICIKGQPNLRPQTLSL